ncbi:MAG: DNA recombination protein RmuC [Firmicutes bacterium]|nr:DNA recombination protein RmuC [Bacillota bacterium]
MTEIQLIYILVALAAVTAVGLLFMIFVNRGLNREVNSMVAAYQNLTRQVDDLKDDNQLMTQTLQGSIKVFGDMISQNQRDSAENMDKRLFELNNRFSHMAVENEQKLENIRNTMEKKISDLTDDNNKQLELMRQTVDEKLQKTLEDRISQSFKLVSERLEQVYKGLGEMQNLAAGVGDLKKVLSNVKTRGILGEVQLGAILEQILSPEQYETDVKTRPGSSERVEFAVKLPGDDDRPVYLPIDAKFPGDAYGKLVDAYEAGDAALVEEAAKALEKVIKSEAKDIRDKYIEPPYTTEFAIMFLPFEGLYAEVVRRGLLEVLQRDYKVNIAGPTTMAALLNSLQMGFKTLAIQKHSSEVWDVLGAVKTEFDKFGDVLEATQARINQANAELDKLIGTRTRSIQRKLRGVTALGENESAALLDMPDFKDL